MNSMEEFVMTLAEKQLRINSKQCGKNIEIALPKVSRANYSSHFTNDGGRCL